MIKNPRVQHVSIPRPPGSDAQARAFYGELLGLEEIPVPESIRHLDLIWYRLGSDTELHLFAEQPLDNPSGRHFCIVVDDLESLRAQLGERGFVPIEATPIPGRPRFFCRDPFNNRVEFTKIEGSP